MPLSSLSSYIYNMSLGAIVLAGSLQVVINMHYPLLWLSAPDLRHYYQLDH